MIKKLNDEKNTSANNHLQPLTTPLEKLYRRTDAMEEGEGTFLIAGAQKNTMRRRKLLVECV